MLARERLNIVDDLVEEQVQEFVSVLVHGRSEYLVLSPKDVQKLVWTDYAYSRFVVDDRLENVLERCEQGLGHAILFSVARGHAEDRTILNGHSLLVLG